MFVYCPEELKVSLGIPRLGQLTLIPGHGHIRGRQEMVMLQVIATENISLQPKVDNRPKFSNTWNSKIPGLN